jgi:hypothetical protein
MFLLIRTNPCILSFQLKQGTKKPQGKQPLSRLPSAAIRWRGRQYSMSGHEIPCLSQTVKFLDRGSWMKGYLGAARSSTVIPECCLRARLIFSYEKTTVLFAFFIIRTSPFAVKSRLLLSWPYSAIQMPENQCHFGSQSKTAAPCKSRRLLFFQIIRKIRLSSY